MQTIKRLLLLVFTISMNSIAGPSCDWKPIKTDTTKSNNYSFQVVTLDCNIDYYKDDNITAQEVVIRDGNNNIVVDHIGSWNWGDDSLNYADEVSIVNTPAGFPHQVILSSVYGGSNISHTYHIYSTTPTLKKIGEVDRPVNQYQANKGDGSEKEVVGFYERDGVFLIDRMTTEGTEAGECNACQKWNVETLKLTDDGLVSLGLREFNISAHLSGNEVFTLPDCYKYEPESCPKYLNRDVNFDGEGEFIKRQLKAGQRFRDSFEVYKNGTLLTDIPFNQIDSSTKFDPVNKTIEIMRSGGACSSEWETYKVEDGKAKSIRLEKYDYMGKDGNRIGCTKYIYEGGVLVSEEKVVGP